MALYDSNMNSSLDAACLAQLPPAGADATGATLRPDSNKIARTDEGPMEGQGRASGTNTLFEISSQPSSHKSGSQEQRFSPQGSAPTRNELDGWEKVEGILRGDDIQDTGYMLLLLHALGGSRIPELIFERAQLPQPRWNDSGAFCNITAIEAGLDQQLLNILSDTDQLIQSVEPFVESDITNDSRAYTLKSYLQTKISQTLNDQEHKRWNIKALKWICFVFPRDQLWESRPSYAAAVKFLLPALIHTLQAARQEDIATRIRSEALEALLAASKVGGLQSRRSVLTMATHFLEDESPPYLQAEMAHQQSNISRLVADFRQSERLIHDYCCRCRDYSDRCIPNFYRHFQSERVSKRLNALYGRLHGSHLENLVQCDTYSLAIEEVDDWRTSKPSSLMECRVLPSRTITVAKIYRSQGLFTDARPSLESCLRTLLPQDSNRCPLLCSLADVYCDLHLPDKANELITLEIEKERQKVAKTKSLRRLLVSLIDVDIQRGLYDNALRIVEELQDTFNELSDLDVSDQLLHVRVLVASARICHYSSRFGHALRRWEATLIRVQAYTSFEGEGFTYAIIHLSMSLAHLESGNDREARSAFERAKKIYSRGVRDFWIPTLAAWGQHLVVRIRSLIGWVI